VGVDIKDKSNSAFIYYADSYIGSDVNSAQTGTQIPWNRWMRVTLVVYKSGFKGILICTSFGTLKCTTHYIS